VALLTGGGRRLRVIADKLVEKAEQGDLQAIREVIDRLDGKAVQSVECSDTPLEKMTNEQLMAIIRAGSPETLAYSADWRAPHDAGALPGPEADGRAAALVRLPRK